MGRRIRAQFEALKRKGQRYVVLGAFGCGAFLAPATEVAEVYAEMVYEYREDLDVVTFAIFYQGYGADNYTPFKNILADKDWRQKPHFASAHKKQWSYYDCENWVDYPEEDNEALENCASHCERQTAGVCSTVHVSDAEIVDVKKMLQVSKADSAVAKFVRRVDAVTGHTINDQSRLIAAVTATAA